MAKEIYKSGNYIITVDADNKSRLFPIGKTVYDEHNSVFRITEGVIEDDQLTISFSDSTSWVDDSAAAYTEATLRTFLRDNTGFRPASGGSDANVVNSDGTYDVDVPGGDILNLPDINNIDSDGSVVVTPAQTPFTATICSGGSVGAMPLKTGQITSYSSFDDGDIQAGRATDFFTLASANPFGTTERFTYIDGTQTYTNAIVIDWSTFDGTNVLGYGQNNNINVNWFDALTGSNTHSVGGYSSGWRLPNNNEVSNLFYLQQTWQLDYAPLSTSLGIGYSHRDLWLSTTRVISSSSAYKIDQIYGIQTKGKTSVGCKYFPVRTFTVTGTTLT